MELAANKVPNTRIHERAAGPVILGLVKLWIYKKAFLFDIDNNKKGQFCDSNHATVIS